MAGKSNFHFVFYNKGYEMKTVSERWCKRKKITNRLHHSVDNQRTNGHVNAHLISGPSKRAKHAKPGKIKVKK